MRPAQRSKAECTVSEVQMPNWEQELLPAPGPLPSTRFRASQVLIGGTL